MSAALSKASLALRRLGPGAVALALFAFVVLYPVGRFLLSPLFPSFCPAGATGVAATVPLVAVLNTIRIGLYSTLAALPFGMAIAWLFERRRWRGSGALLAVLWVVFLTPSYLLTSGWQIVFSQPGLANGWLARLFFSEVGIVFLLALKGLPFAVLAARTSWRALGAELSDAARVLVADRRRRKMVVLRLLLPSAGAAFAVVFIETIQEFGIPATLGEQIHLPILTYAIYEKLATTPLDFRGAAILSWLMVGMALVVALAHRQLAVRHSGALVHGKRRVASAIGCTRGEAALAATGLAALALLGIGIPLTAIVAEAVRPASAFPIPWNSLAWSAIYGVLAALAGVLLVPPLVGRGMRAGWLKDIVGALALGNMAVPGLVLGAAYAIAFNGGWLPLYGTPPLLIIGYVAIQVPMLIRFLQAPFDHLHHGLSDAARVHGLSWSARVFDIDAPLLAPALTWGWAMAFGQVFFELPISMLLYPPGRAPVAVKLIWFNQNLHYTDEARLALAGIGVSLAIALIAGLAIRVAFRPGRMGAETT